MSLPPNCLVLEAFLFRRERTWQNEQCP